MTRCDHCNTEAVIVLPGSQEVRAALGFLLARGTTQQSFCLPCAVAQGWPWMSSENPKQHRTKEAAQ